MRIVLLVLEADNRIDDRPLPATGSSFAITRLSDSTELQAGYRIVSLDNLSGCTLGQP
jgi:hypothetical protein